MAKVTYIALIEAGDGSYGVVFPDLDGCVSWGETQDRAVQNASEALSLHLEGMAEEGLAIPEPSDLVEIAKATPPGEPHLFVGVTVETPDTSERVNIYLARNVLERIDATCRDRGVNRSAFFAQAAKTQMALWRGDAAAAAPRVGGLNEPAGSAFQASIPFGMKPTPRG